MTATATQLALVLDPLADELRPAEQAAVEAKVQDDDERRGRDARRARSCSCPTPWGDVGDGRCCRCGRTVAT